MTVGSSTESLLIQRIRGRVATAAPGVVLGIGDDAAVVEPVRGRLEVLTTDTLVEGVHFRREWSSAHAIGRKAVLVNLSDLAAMGAAPHGILLSLCLPASLTLDDFDALIDGVLAETDRARATLIGGNITSSPGPLVVTVAATGNVHPRRVLRRDGGKVGHELYVTGAIGAAAAGLGMLASDAARPTPGTAPADCVARYEIPPQLVAFARAVAGNRAASACVDLSDGLADGVRQIALASGTGAVIDGSALPLDEAAAAWWTAAGKDPIAEAISGGEDYELLFAIPSRRGRALRSAAARTGGVRVTRVGILTADQACVISQGEGARPLAEGFSHFRAKSLK